MAVQKKFAVFDIDGTLIRWQLYHAVVDKLAKQGLLGSTAHEQIHEARMKWKRRQQNSGFSEYERTLINLYEQAIKNISPAEFDSYANAVIEEYKDQTYTYTRDLLRELKQKNYTLLAISGSQHELVEKIAVHYGFDDFIATQYDRNESGFSGKVYVASHDKKSALETLINKHQLSLTESFAVGDSSSDIAMLEMAEHPIAFNPDSKLYTAAKRNNWKIVLERKDVVYEFEVQNEHYVLV